MNQIIRLKENSEEKKRIENLLNKTMHELKSEKKKLLRLTEELKKEFEDVQKLEGSGLTALFHSFLGNKDAKLNKERQEYLSAKLKYENCKKEIEDLEFEIQKLESKLSQIGNPETEYNNILAARSNLLKERKDEKFVKYEELLEIYYSQKKEVGEAIYAGKRALQGLNYAIHYLRKAKNWGTFDLLGGGLIATAVKHSNIDEAKGLIYDVQIWLRRLKRELSDIDFSILPEMNIQLNSFSTFADYFFDNLIFDWVVQSKINRSLDGCLNTHSQVSSILNRLKSTDSNLTAKYKSTKTEFTNYIENAIQ